MENKYKGYKATHQVDNKIYSYTAPCSLECEQSILCKLTYFSKNPLIISVFVNATEYENCEFNLTEKIVISKYNSYEKHMLCKKGNHKEIKFHIPVALKQLVMIPINCQNPYILDQRYHMIIRIEPKEYKHRFVNMYYLQLQEKKDHVHVEILKQKQEVEQKAFYIYDIYGLDNLKKFKMNYDQLTTYCTICMDKQIAVIIIPCRHMCLCLDCAMLFNNKKPNGQPLMPAECPVCRNGIKSFINIQGLNTSRVQINLQLSQIFSSTQIKLIKFYLYISYKLFNNIQILIQFFHSLIFQNND